MLDKRWEAARSKMQRKLFVDALLFNSGKKYMLKFHPYVAQNNSLQDLLTPLLLL